MLLYGWVISVSSADGVPSVLSVSAMSSRAEINTETANNVEVTAIILIVEFNFAIYYTSF